ncbi:MAG: KEOPS complex kinase/ATPase Bud32 [Candidatus Micrarchaeia archaeon]
MKIISEGAEAHIYETTVFGKAAVLKYRQIKRYRIKALDEALRAKRTKIEARALITAQGAGIKVPGVLLVGRYEIFLERIEGITLADIFAKSAAKAPAKVLKDAGTYLAMLHAHNIVHGDYTPANIMLSKGTTYIIDFGLSTFTNSMEDKALDLLLMKRSLQRGEFDEFEKSYKKHYASSTEILKRMRGIELRGRYQVRTLLSTAKDA